MHTPNIEIRPFRDGDARAFRELNEEWIAMYFGIEEHDRVQLGNPEGNILQRGGQIYMVVADEETIGCCALVPSRPGVYELAKMAVSPRYRGYGIGRKLLEYVIAQAKALGADSLYLGSSKKLANAVHLYEALGFRHLPPEKVGPMPYARANVFMELDLSATASPETSPSALPLPA